MSALTEEDGKALLKIARDSVSYALLNKQYQLPQEVMRRFSERRGVFVTLHKDKELRGCIGFLQPVFPLGRAIAEAAKAAAFSDPRFKPLSKDELSEVSFEISVLTVPELISSKGEGCAGLINVGKDGLVVEMDGCSGLLLPQVAEENKLSVEEFLSCTCLKAGLPEDSWKDKRCRIYKFQAQIFSE